MLGSLVGAELGVNALFIDPHKVHASGRTWSAIFVGSVRAAIQVTALYVAQHLMAMRVRLDGPYTLWLAHGSALAALTSFINIKWRRVSCL